MLSETLNCTGRLVMLWMTVTRSRTLSFDTRVSDLQSDEIAASQFAVDCEVKQRQFSEIAPKFKASSNGPDLFGQQWALMANQTSFVPRSAF